MKTPHERRYDTPFLVNTTSSPRTKNTSALVNCSRVAQDLSHRVRERCVSQNSHSSHAAQHVARALVVVSFTLQRYVTFHMHSNPTFYPTFNQSFLDVHFTWRFTLRGSIEMCLSVTWLNRSRKQVVSPRISLKRTPLYWLNRCSFHRPKLTSTCGSAETIATPSPESDLDDDQIRNLLASPPYLQERSKCRPITSLPFLERKLSVKFFSLPRKCRETAAMLSHKRKSSQETPSNREGISSGSTIAR